MTFLEFVCEKLMGPPAWNGGNRSNWLCPFHEERHPSFSTLPPKPGCKDRFKCFSCGAWGDELDMLKLFFPREDYNARLERLSAMRIQYEAGEGAKPDHSVHIPRGGEIEKEDHDHNVLAAFCELDDIVRQPIPDWAVGRVAAWRLLAHAADAAQRCHVTLDQVAEKCAQAALDYRQWLKEQVQS